MQFGCDAKAAEHTRHECPHKYIWWGALYNLLNEGQYAAGTLNFFFAMPPPASSPTGHTQVINFIIIATFVIKILIL